MFNEGSFQTETPHGLSPIQVYNTYDFYSQRSCAYIPIKFKSSKFKVAFGASIIGLLFVRTFWNLLNNQNFLW